jgi:4-amino-4-deoxy-L-arabinose transferase-like glycosyltransferase
MNQPLRLAQGEMLYSEVRHIYGPLSPYINATLYRLFGPSLNVLYADGIITALIILALVYWIARRLMGRAAATASTLEVMWLCAFKQAGNYVFPYSYSALHGCALALASLALTIKATGLSEESKAETTQPVKRGYLIASAIVAGLAILAKTEMGLAAVAAGAVALWLAGQPRILRSLGLTAMFFLPAIGLVVVVYVMLAGDVGWDTLSRESFLFFQNLPQELVYYNKRMSGFDAPIESLAQMAGAAARVAAMGGIVAALSLLIAGRRVPHVSASDRAVTDAGQIRTSLLWALLAFSIALFLFVPMGGTVSWDKGPYLAMPLLLVGLLVLGLIGYQKRSGDDRRQSFALIVVSVFALASLARVLLRVRSGGAYSSYLLPASIILFTYFWAHPFADLLREGSARRFARRFIVVIFLLHATATGGVLAYRYRVRNAYPIATRRGTMLAPTDAGIAIREAIEFVNSHTAPSEPVAVMPEGTSINFFTDRRNPLREEITTPGFLDEAGEERAIRQLEDSGTRLILITNRATSEFGPKSFGRDYNRRLMSWIEERFEQVAVFGPSKDAGLQIGDRTFFIRAYLRR